MEPRYSMSHSQGSPITHILSRINVISRIDTYSFKIHFMASHLRLGLPKGLFSVGVPVNILKALLPSSIVFYFCFFLTSPFSYITYSVVRVGSFYEHSWRTSADLLSAECRGLLQRQRRT